MSDWGDDIVARARRLVGTPFRPQGRDPRTGLDCAGVVATVFELPMDFARRNYRLRGDHSAEIAAVLLRRCDAVTDGSRRAADVLLVAVAADQVHLAIWCGESFVHADARLRRVVETPGPPPWPALGAFRMHRPQSELS
jgi:lipoprotein Spr